MFKLILKYFFSFLTGLQFRRCQLRTSTKRIRTRFQVISKLKICSIARSKYDLFIYPPSFPRVLIGATHKEFNQTIRFLFISSLFNDCLQIFTVKAFHSPKSLLSSKYTTRLVTVQLRTLSKIYCAILFYPEY